MAPDGKDKKSEDGDGASLGNAAERASRQERNRAERQARRSAKQAERAARKDAPPPQPESAPEMLDCQDVAPHAQDALATGSFNILIVAQAGRLSRQALLFCASLRLSAPDFRGRLIVAEPQPAGAWSGVDTRVDPKIRKQLSELGAELRPFTAQHFGRAYPHGNKIEALSILPADEPFVFFDSDTLITGPLDQVPTDFQRPSASMRRSATWPEPPLYGPDYAEIWRSLYTRFGLDFETSLDSTQFPDHWERFLYFNAGWFFGADPRQFGQRFLDWSLAVANDPGEALACQSLNPWLDQVVLPLVIHSLHGGRPGPELAGLDGDISCHYRNLSLLYARESDDAVMLAEKLFSDPSIACHFAEDEGFQRLVAGAEGREVVRPMFKRPSNLSEQPIRQQLKRAGLWFR